MLNPSITPASSVNWRRLGTLLVILAILTAMVALPGPPVAAPRVHDTLLDLAASQPLAPVNVIVQRATPDTNLAPAVQRLGGTIIRELKLINAAVVTLSAQAAIELGRSAEVRWVSLDAPMVDHACYYPECASTSQATGNWIDAVKLRELWNKNRELQGQGVNVAVIDSGIDTSHTDFDGRIVRNVAVHRNLVFNGSFEDDLSSWSVAEGAAPAEISDDASYNHNYEGEFWSQHGLYHPAIAPGAPPVSMVQPLHSFIPGTTYTFRATGKVYGYGCDSRSDNWVGVRGVANGRTWGTGFVFCDSSYEELQTQFTVPEGTESLEVVTLQNSTSQDFLADEISIAPAVVEENGGPVLIGLESTPPTEKDLSAEGSIDWYYRGMGGDVKRVDRREGTPRISLYQVGRFIPIPFSGDQTNFAWTNGSIIASAEEATGGISAVGVDRGFEIKAPATTNLRTLRIYLTLRNTELNVNGYLSDGSVLPFTDTSVDTTGYADGMRHVMYSFTYRASGNAQVIKVRFTNLASENGQATVVFHGATLAEGSAVPIAASYTSHDSVDQYGHGTLIAGLIAGDGSENSEVVGVAPRAGLVNVRVIDADGEATVSDVIRGFEWIYENHERYNIRVVNVSLNSNVAESHMTSPLSAAVEILWINRIVVVVSAGNNGNDGVLYPPANDPLVITVGSVDHNPSRNPHDLIAPFSAAGFTAEGNHPKPEILAPGVNLVTTGCTECLLNQTYTQNIPWEMSNANEYFRASGTSLSAALVSGAAALVLQKSPTLDPDQVKYRLMSTGGTQFGTDHNRYLNIYAAVTGTSTESKNEDVTISSMLYTGADALTIGSAKWGSAKWGSAKWGSAKWGSAKWGSATLTSSLRGSVRGMSFTPPTGVYGDLCQPTMTP